MSTRQAIDAYLSRERPKFRPPKELLQRYAPRCPITQLPGRYRVTEANKDPPLLHFAIPVDIFDLYRYAGRHNLIEYSEKFPNLISPVSALVATQRLSEEVEYEVKFAWPFEATADSHEDQEDVIEMVQEELGLGKSMRPKWYFDFFDKWRPGHPDH
ncbi:hypothetical protein L210DRAFT_3649397 [Boletus edulis BED1]|uniref:Uncharacterized protein n=1 Tax=Boletus edulis BED1 TaxID=1328754 RepID=A0AAD4BLZ1_BOLED|nr:hypothetical protein L210DRAFT_3649397 [Boletus edulis BED1]